MRAFPGLRHSSALLVAVLASSCTPSTPPAAPDETAQAAAPESAPSENLPASPAEPEPAPATPAEPATAAAAAPHAPKDTRGKEQIQQVMAANREKVRACYDAALAQNPGIKGSLVIDFVIDPRGEVKQAEVNWSASDLHIPELDTCAAEAVRAIKFPPSSRGLESKVTYPFNFNPPRDALPTEKTSEPQQTR